MPNPLCWCLSTAMSYFLRTWMRHIYCAPSLRLRPLAWTWMGWAPHGLYWVHPFPFTKALLFALCIAKTIFFNTGRWRDFHSNTQTVNYALALQLYNTLIYLPVHAARLSQVVRSAKQIHSKAHLGPPQQHWWRQGSGVQEPGKKRVQMRWDIYVEILIKGASTAHCWVVSQNQHTFFNPCLPVPSHKVHTSFTKMWLASQRASHRIAVFSAHKSRKHGESR